MSVPHIPSSAPCQQGVEYGSFQVLGSSVQIVMESAVSAVWLWGLQLISGRSGKIPATAYPRSAPDVSCKAMLRTTAKGTRTAPSASTGHLIACGCRTIVMVIVPRREATRR
eukprot:3935426-Rhodomonas_salina.4